MTEKTCYFDYGDDFLDVDGDHKTYGIHRLRDDTTDTWYNMIEVYGDSDLRDYICEFLKEHPYKSD